MCQRNCHGVVSRKRDMTGDHLEHRDTERIQITPLIAVSAPRLLRGNVVDGSHYRCRIHGLGGDGSRDPEIRDLHLAVHGNQHILRFDVPVDDMLLVGSLDPGGNLDRDPDRFFHFKMTFFRDIAL